MVHLQQRYLSPAEYLSTIIIPPATAISRLETWSDSASEEIYIFYSPARGFSGHPALITLFPRTIKYSPAGSTRKIPSKAPLKFSPAGFAYKILGNVLPGLYHPQQ